MRTHWISKARQSLIELRHPDGSWSYRRNTASAVEPTALAGLCLVPTHPAIAQEAANWLAACQNADGSLGVTRSLAAPGWPTSYACLLWAALESNPTERARATGWLEAKRGTTVENPDRWPLGHDMSLIGWPWVDGTHSWVEPTCLAILALRRFGQNHARTRQGLRLLHDRAIPTGGWNMGNPVVFGTPLRAFPTPTGLALLALRWSDHADQGVVESAFAYLRTTIAQTLAPASLAWGTLGLRAWHEEPDESLERLDLSYQQMTGNTLNPAAIALLVLAADPEAPSLLGLSPLAGLNFHE